MQAPEMRRKDRLLTEAETLSVLARCTYGTLASVGVDGHPYAVPLNYVFDQGVLYFHTVKDNGHLYQNLRHDPRISFAVTDAGPIIATGDFACYTSHAYESAIIFGSVRFVTEPGEIQRIFDLYVDKYIPEQRAYIHEYPLLGGVHMMAVQAERLTGKRRETVTAETYRKAPAARQAEVVTRAQRAGCPFPQGE